MAKVVLTDYVWDSLDVERTTLDGLATLVALKTKTPAEFLPEATDCDALLNTYAGPITAAVMKQMPRCRIIARYGIGVDTIDLEAATAAGIIVTNNPTYCIEEVAEHTMALLLACARKVPFYERHVRGGRWELPPGKPMFRLVGRTLGLVGFGNIARAGAVRAPEPGRPAGCALDTTDPEPLPDSHPLRGRDNVIVTPHAAWYSEQAMVGLQAGAPGEVRRVLTGQWPVNVVNRAVKGKNRAGI